MSRAAALKLERAGDLTGALEQYQAALRLAPDDPALLADIARLAERMDMPDVAAALWSKVGGLEGVDGEARALSELGRFDEAAAVLQTAITSNLEEPRLWGALGVTLTQQGRPDTALTFLDEALRLDPSLASATYNRGCAHFDLGHWEQAQTDLAAAAALAKRPADRAMIDFAAATLSLARGDLAAGWDAYETRLSLDVGKPVVFEGAGAPWTPDADLMGKRLLVLAEQGLGDEIMFANLLPDVLEALGPDGRLAVAVDPRLIELFTRSFPGAEIVAHATRREGARLHRSAPGAGPADLWAPMASLTRRFRRSLDSFPARPAYLTPDPVRVVHWRGWLGEGPPAVGVTWRSGKQLGDRRRGYMPLPDWQAVLAVPGVRFVNIQYGEAGDELARLDAMSGGRIITPPLDIRDDIDDLAALCAALDGVVAAGNATAALAGACGCRTVIITGAHAWPRLGSPANPWFPSALALAPAAPGDWSSVGRAAAALVAQM